jgi:hypothetical protein
MSDLFRKTKNPADAPPPGRHERGFDHCRLLIGVNEPVGGAQYSGMFGRQLRPPAKQDEIARPHLSHCDLRPEMPPRRVPQPILAAAFGPIRLVGRRQFRLATMDLPPDAAHQPQAIAADTLEARLMPIRRPDPASRSLDNPIRKCRRYLKDRAIAGGFAAISLFSPAGRRWPPRVLPSASLRTGCWPDEGGGLHRNRRQSPLIASRVGAKRRGGVIRQTHLTHRAPARHAPYPHPHSRTRNPFRAYEETPENSMNWKISDDRWQSSCRTRPSP